MSNYKVLSIQSHVVHGYVGNKAAVFPLQVTFQINVHNTNYDNLNSHLNSCLVSMLILLILSNSQIILNTNVSKGKDSIQTN